MLTYISLCRHSCLEDNLLFYFFLLLNKDDINIKIYDASFEEKFFWNHFLNFFYGGYVMKKITIPLLYKFSLSSYCITKYTKENTISVSSLYMLSKVFKFVKYFRKFQGKL